MSPTNPTRMKPTMNPLRRVRRSFTRVVEQLPLCLAAGLGLLGAWAADVPAPPPVASTQVGVWRVYHISYTLRHRWHALLCDARTFQQLTRDIYAQSGGFFTLLFVAVLAEKTRMVLTWFLFNHILFLTEAGMARGEFDVEGIAWTVAMRILVGILFAALGYWVRRAESTVSSKIVRHFEARVFEWKACADSATLKKHTHDGETPSAESIWSAYRGVLDALGNVAAIAAQIFFAGRNFVSTRETWVYTVLFLAKPVLAQLLGRRLSQTAWIGASTNRAYNRMHVLEKIVETVALKQELMVNGCTDYLLREYRKARVALGGTSVDDPVTQEELSDSVLLVIAAQLCGELHLIYFFLTALREPSSFSLAKMTMIEDGGETIGFQSYYMLAALNNAWVQMRSVQRIYELLATSPVEVVDGVEEYDVRDGDERGMELEMRDVSFEYRNADSGSTAAAVLQNISMHISPGQLVVIVGANGSGKSTLTKLLARLYDPSSGTVLINGRDLREYRRGSLYARMALLSQHSGVVGGLSFEENIRLGLAADECTAGMTEAAALKGQADGFIEARERGYDTVLEPAVPECYGDYWTEAEYRRMDDRRKEEFGVSGEREELSGGQEQRLAAARTFMRLASRDIKLLVADEPSSALDPEAELNLFNALLEERNGRTMIFITHRFGCLVKRADLILCMRDGRIVEQGTHEELTGRKGAYCAMYDTQATAFCE
ncbi:ABC transporter protein [Mycena kentingensis (nom. inval.)]|nr:ABC transporter protein [Mycena kentingensis (nom. inval.)]